MSEAELRRNKDNLVTSGTAIFAFAIWEVLRGIMRTLVDTERFQFLVDATNGEMSKFSLGLMVIIILLVYYSLGLIVRTFVGLSARLEGKGKLKVKILPFCAIALLVFSIIRVLVDVVDLIEEKNNIGIRMATIVMDFAFLYAMIQLVKSLIKVRKYKE